MSDGEQEGRWLDMSANESPHDINILTKNKLQGTSDVAISPSALQAFTNHLAAIGTTYSSLVTDLGKLVNEEQPSRTRAEIQIDDLSYQQLLTYQQTERRPARETCLPAHTSFPDSSDHYCLLNPRGYMCSSRYDHLAKMDVELLISKVFVRPALWDKRNKLHANKNVVDKLWAEICRDFDCEEVVVKKKWKYLRDQFAVELGKYPPPRSGDPADVTQISKWQYFHWQYFHC
ncbi:hypothetical protein Pmani_006440 [Petrolisthes manimaculis]|uniref:MADF domain-containing protein n=1 Tax=Petrolisthes manimaculis TaxID=1843537 RepID=A0AAE1UGF1_9EUCA|nr:hypothetical protein Pmani_006440 [Petrolisthes manimaculis]